MVVSMLLLRSFSLFNNNMIVAELLILLCSNLSHILIGKELRPTKTH